MDQALRQPHGATQGRTIQRLILCITFYCLGAGQLLRKSTQYPGLGTGRAAAEEQQ